MKKKIIAALMAMTMTLSMVACGNATAATPATEETSVEATVEAATEAVEAEAANAEESLEAAAEEVKEEGEALEEDLEENAIPALGKVEGNVYTNEYFGLKVSLPENEYMFADDAMMEEVYGYATDILKETDNKAVAKQLESGDAQCVAIGFDSTGLNNINITVQQNVLLANAIFDEKAVLNLSVSAAKEALEAQGIEITSTEISEMEIAGENHAVLKMDGEYQGVEYHGLMVNLQKGNYMLAMAATSFTGDNTAEMFDFITALD